MPVRRGLLGQPRRHRSVDQHSPEPRAHGHSRRVSRTFDKVADVKSVGAKSTIDFFFQPPSWESFSMASSAAAFLCFSSKMGICSNLHRVVSIHDIKSRGNIRLTVHKVDKCPVCTRNQYVLNVQFRVHLLTNSVRPCFVWFEFRRFSFIPISMNALRYQSCDRLIF
jgi:hypothetical protein